MGNKEPSTTEELSDLLRQTVPGGREILDEIADANRQLHRSARELCDSLNQLIPFPSPPILSPKRRRRWL